MSVVISKYFFRFSNWAYFDDTIEIISILCYMMAFILVLHITTFLEAEPVFHFDRCIQNKHSQKAHS